MSSQLHVSWRHIGSLGLPMVGAFIPQKSAVITSQDFYFGELAYQHTTSLRESVTQFGIYLFYTQMSTVVILSLGYLSVARFGVIFSFPHVFTHCLNFQQGT